MSLIAANSRQILVRFLSDSRQILISVLSDSRQILVTMVVFKTIVTYINSPLPWRLKAFSVLLILIIYFYVFYDFYILDDFYW